MKEHEKVLEIYRERGIPVRVRKIIEKICDKNSLDVIDVVGIRRNPKLFDCRSEIYKELRSEILENGTHKFSFPLIGKWFCRNHASIIYAADDKIRIKRQIKSAIWNSIKRDEKNAHING